jgi:hypothetical protein
MENLTSTLVLKVATDAATYNACSSQQPAAGLYALSFGIYLVDSVHSKRKGQSADTRIVKLLLLIYPHDYGFLQQRLYMLSVILSR